MIATSQRSVPKTCNGEKKGRKLRKSCVQNEQHRVTAHSMNMTEIINIMSSSMMKKLQLPKIPVAVDIVE